MANNLTCHSRKITAEMIKLVMAELPLVALEPLLNFLVTSEFSYLLYVVIFFKTVSDKLLVI